MRVETFGRGARPREIQGLRRRDWLRDTDASLVPKRSRRLRPNPHRHRLQSRVTKPIAFGAPRRRNGRMVASTEPGLDVKPLVDALAEAPINVTWRSAPNTTEDSRSWQLGQETENGTEHRTVQRVGIVELGAESAVDVA